MDIILYCLGHKLIILILILEYDVFFKKIVIPEGFTCQKTSLSNM